MITQPNFIPKSIVRFERRTTGDARAATPIQQGASRRGPPTGLDFAPERFPLPFNALGVSLVVSEQIFVTQPIIGLKVFAQKFIAQFLERLPIQFFSG